MLILLRRLSVGLSEAQAAVSDRQIPQVPTPNIDDMGSSATDFPQVTTNHDMSLWDGVTLCRLSG